MNTNTDAIDTLVKQIVSAIDTKISDLPYDKTFPSVIYGKDSKGKYQITFEGRLRSVSNALPTEFTPGDWVWVKIPSGRLRDMHICGIRKE